MGGDSEVEGWGSLWRLGVKGDEFARFAFPPIWEKDRSLPVPARLERCAVKEVVETSQRGSAKLGRSRFRLGFHIGRHFEVIADSRG